MKGWVERSKESKGWFEGISGGINEGMSRPLDGGMDGRMN